MKHEQKSTELEEFLEQEIKKLERESSHSKDDTDHSDIIWDAAEAAVALGKAKNVAEVANAVMNSDAFAHLTDEVVAVVKRAAPEEKAAEGMVGDFQADSAMAIEFEEGGGTGSNAGPGADEKPEEGYLFSAVTPDSALHAEEDEAIFGGGKPPSDDDDESDRGKREPKKKPKKAKAEDAGGDDKPGAKKSKPKSKSKSKGKSKPKDK